MKDDFGENEAVHHRLHVGKDGRVLIPNALRKAAGITRDSVVVAEVVDGVLCLDTIENRVARAQAMVRTFDKGTGSIWTNSSQIAGPRPRESDGHTR